MYNEDDFDWTQRSDYYQPNKKSMLNHNWKMVLGLVILFLVGGLGQLHDIGNWGAWVDMITAILVGAEHLLNGKTW